MPTKPTRNKPLVGLSSEQIKYKNKITEKKCLKIIDIKKQQKGMSERPFSQPEGSVLTSFIRN